LTASIAQHYHERTKYHPETIHANQPSIDWNQPPLPYKEYKIGSVTDLKPYLADEPDAFSNDLTGLWWRRLSRLLLCSYGLT
ncbi:MAG TPA: SagB-type dehydrogenase domain-containing protein, partial [Crinalium sp.]